MYGDESWTIKKANSWRIDAFELWCWRRLLRVPWTARRLNQSILKEIIPEYPLEGFYWSWNSNILSPWCRVDSLDKTRILEIIESRRRRGGQRMRVLDGTPPLMSVDMSLNKLRETVKDREVWVAAVHGVAELDKSEWHNNWSFRYILLWTAFCIFVVFTFSSKVFVFFFFLCWNSVHTSPLSDVCVAITFPCFMFPIFSWCLSMMKSNSQYQWHWN